MTDRKQALQFLEEGIRLAKDKSQPANAQLSYTLIKSACVADPTFGNAWYHAGNANAELGLKDASVACYRRALNEPNDYQIPAAGGSKLRSYVLVNMSVRLQSMGRPDEARVAVEEALKIDDKLDLAWANLAMIESVMGAHEEAVAAARKAVALSDTPTNRMTLSFALLFAGNYKEGFREYEARFPYRLPQFLAYPFPQWHGEHGGRLFLVSEQGIGDTLSFSRFLPAAARRCKMIYAMVHPELIRLFRAHFHDLKNVVFLPAVGPFPASDYWSTFVSLPTAMDLSEEAIRGATMAEPPPFDSEPVWKMQGTRMHIGIAWAGSAANDIDVHRSIPLRHFLDLYKVPGIQLYSLQVDARAKEVHDQGAAVLAYDLAPFIRDIADTVGIMRHLDLIITCESALGHIAGYCDKECWVAYSHNGRDYRAGHDGSNPLWYKGHRFFKQGPDARWEPVFERIVSCLQNTMNVINEAQREAAQ